MQYRAHEGDDLDGLSQAHVITEHGATISNKVIVEKSHSILLVISQVLVDVGRYLTRG